MNREDTVAVLTQIGEARKAWAQAHIALNSDVYSLMRRMLHEAAVNRMSIEEVASLTGFTVSRVRQLMRDMGMNPKSSRSLLAKNSATVLAENATILGIEPSDFDLMSPLAYLPMGKDMRKTIEDKSVSSVTEVSGNTVTVNLDDLNAVLRKADYVNDRSLVGPVDRMGDAIASIRLRETLEREA